MKYDGRNVMVYFLWCFFLWTAFSGLFKEEVTAFVDIAHSGFVFLEDAKKGFYLDGEMTQGPSSPFRHSKKTSERLKLRPKFVTVKQYLYPSPLHTMSGFQCYLFQNRYLQINPCLDKLQRYLI